MLLCSLSQKSYISFPVFYTAKQTNKTLKILYEETENNINIDKCKFLNTSEVTEVMSLVIYVGSLMSSGRVLQLQTYATCRMF